MRVALVKDHCHIYCVMKEEGSYALATGDVQVQVDEAKLYKWEKINRAFWDLQDELEELYHRAFQA